MGVVEAILYGIVQGVTEWLPISSTAHLRIVPSLLGRPDPGAAFTAVIQLGTILAVLIYFRSDLSKAISAWAVSLVNPIARATPEARLGWAVFWGSLPIVVCGLVFRDYIQGQLRSLYVVSGALILFGLVMFWADTKRVGNRQLDGVTVGDGLLVGLFQCLSLIPGVSRSGSTMTGAFLAGYDRPTAARISFLLSVPSITAAGVYQLYEERRAILGQELLPTLIATLVSFIVGYASIAWLIKYLQKRGLTAFVLYRAVLGLLLLGLLQFGVLKPLDGESAQQAQQISGVH